MKTVKWGCRGCMCLCGRMGQEREQIGVLDSRLEGEENHCY